MDTVYTMLYILFGVLFLVYMPASLWLRSKRQILMSPVLKETLHYCLDEKGVHVSVNEQTADLEWNMIYKMISTKSNLLIYSSRINAYVIPLVQLQGLYPRIQELAGQKLEKYRLRMK